MNIPLPPSDRAKHLLACAETLFLKHGYHGTSLQMLIKLAGGSRRNIYAEFGNKKGLFIAVLQRKISEVHLILADTDNLTEPRARLVNVCCTFLNKLLEPDMVTLFKLLINTAQDISDIGDIFYQHALVDGPKGLANYLQQLNDRNIFKIHDSQHASQLLLGMVKGHLHTHVLLDPRYKPSQKQITQQVEQAVDIFLNGVSI